MKNLIFTLSLICVTLLSCSDNDKTIERLTSEKIEKMSSDELVRDLLIENEADYEQLGRIFKCSVSTIKRIEKKESYLTENAQKEFQNLLVNVKIVGKDAFKENDPYYDSWIRSFRYWLNKWVWWAVAGFAIFFLIGSSEGDAGFGVYIDMFITIVFGGGYLITWVTNMIWSYEIPNYLYSDKLNPIIETLF
uniref:hypothetical protein n=1 Tax=uncultured Tenacibaculum sp. TaxID=174713 RepID=UPI0026110C30|nr:hypothetical protein [uncultured Tenacibaculum sp.]